MLLLNYIIPKKKTLSKTIRNRGFNNWKFKVKRKDNFTCQSCGKRKRIEAHHIKGFGIIFKEFLKKYKQFSPKKDRNILLYLAREYKPFSDVNNGKTLCTDCHEIIEEHKEEMLLPRQFKKEMMI